MAFGPTSEVVDKEKKYEVLYGLAEKYLPDHLEPAEETINKMIDRTGVYEIIVSHFTGKSKKRPKVS